MNYIELTLDINPKEPWTEIALAQLSDIDFESFTENDGRLQAYIQAPLFNEGKLINILEFLTANDVSVNYSKKQILEENWNATWEADFQPVAIDDKLIIRAPFHECQTGFEEEVIIQPQMSFGTGHHQTTWLLASILCEKNLTQLQVLDSGTGTGVLAILALKRGAQIVIGTDIEPGAVENAHENCARNGYPSVDMRLGDIDCVTERNFDIIIANINKNVLKIHLPHYAERSKTDGELYLSGFFVTDTKELIDAAEHAGFRHEATFNKEEWAVLKLIKL